MENNQPLTKAQFDALAAEAYKEAQRRKKHKRQRYDTPDGIVQFVREVLHAEPTDYQVKILKALVEHRRVAVRGVHGMGKTCLSAWVIIWSLYAFPTSQDTKCMYTASVWRQVQKYTARECVKWVYKGSLEPRPRVLDTSLKLRNKEAFGASSDNPYQLEGLHGDNVVIVMDESKAIPDAFFDALEGALSTGNTYALMLSTPGNASGRFYDIHSHKPGFEDWHTIHITLEEAIAAGRVSAEWAEARKRQWGETSAIYVTRVLGEFADSGEDSVIPLSWVESAQERWRECMGKGEGHRYIGCDPARFGSDQTAIAQLVGQVIERVDTYALQDTMTTTGRVIAAVGGDKSIPIATDVIGIGSGVQDRLNEQGFKAIPCNVATAAKDSSGQPMKDATGNLEFVNLRSFLWWLMRESLDPQGSVNLAIPPDDDLTADLTAPLWGYNSAGKITIESKDEIRKRIGRSTDKSDAVGLALYARFISQTPALQIVYHRRNFIYDEYDEFEE